MAVTISFFNQKGGTAKTSTSLNFSAFAGVRKRKVLLIDLDSQMNATYASGGDMQVPNSIKEVIEGACEPGEAIQKCKYYDLIGSRADLRELKIEDVFALRNALEQIKGNYDYIVIDNPPNISPITINSLVASDTMILTMEPAAFSFMGMSEFYDTLHEIHDLGWNKDLYVLGVLLVRASMRSKTDKRLQKLIAENVGALDTTLFDCTIRDCAVVKECQEKQIALPDYKPSKNNAAMDYNGFTTQVFKRLER